MNIKYEEKEEMVSILQSLKKNIGLKFHQGFSNRFDQLNCLRPTDAFYFDLSSKKAQSKGNYA